LANAFKQAFGVDEGQIAFFHQENLLWQNLQDLSKIFSIYKDFTYFNPCTIHLVKYSSEFHQLR